jgi:arylsulfatase
MYSRKPHVNPRPYRTSHARKWLAIGFAFFAITIALPNTAYAADERPNVVLIVIDTLRADAMSCYGYDRITTPRLDEFANANLQFKRTFAPAGLTPPSMAAMMTGRLPYYPLNTPWNTFTSFGFDRFRKNRDDVGLPESLDSLAEFLQREGYATGAFVTNPFVSERFQFDQGFDTMEDLRDFGGPLPHLRAGEVVKQSKAWMKSHTEGPFFLYVHVMDVHYPYLPPEPYRKQFSFERVPGKTDEEVGAAWDKQKHIENVSVVSMREHARGLYDSALFYADEQIGVLIDALKDQGVAENTIVVITSDHGEEFLDHGDTSHKGKLYEEHVGVPLLMKLPEQQTGQIDALVQNFDIMPTILDYCGIEGLDEATDAVSLRPLIEGKADHRGRPVFGNQIPTKQMPLPQFQFVRTKDHALLYGAVTPDLSELYNLANDPHEHENIYDAKSPVVTQLLADITSIVDKLESETKSNSFKVDHRAAVDDVVTPKQWNDAVKVAADNMTPEQWEAAVKAAMKNMTPEELAALMESKEASDKGGELDDDTRERLESLGYVD